MIRQVHVFWLFAIAFGCKLFAVEPMIPPKESDQRFVVVMVEKKDSGGFAFVSGSVGKGFDAIAIGKGNLEPLILTDKGPSQNNAVSLSLKKVEVVVNLAENNVGTRFTTLGYSLIVLGNTGKVVDDITSVFGFIRTGETGTLGIFKASEFEKHFSIEKTYGVSTADLRKVLIQTLANFKE